MLKTTNMVSKIENTYYRKYYQQVETFSPISLVVN